MAGDEIRRRLIDAAAEVFAEKGYDGARVQQIAERADLTTGAIYNRFSGKSELLLEAVEFHSEPVLPMLLAADLRTADVLGAAAAALANAKPTLGRALVHELLLSARREPELFEMIRPQFDKLNDRLAHLIKEDQDAGLVDPDIDVHALVVFCQAVGLGMDCLQMVGAEMPDPEGWQGVVDRLIAAAAPSEGVEEKAGATDGANSDSA